jgi:enamine deaminase RidA (YjgF/YER057c/UK114 family)
VQAIVSETFTERRQPLPALSVVQVGALPMQPATAADSVGPLKTALTSASLELADVRRVTCFLNSLEHVETVRTQITTAFPEAAATYVQLRRDSAGEFVACEAVGAPVSAASKAIVTSGSPPQVVRIGPGKIVISGTQMAFGSAEGDIKLAFDRLDRALESAGTDMKKVVFARVYPLTKSAEQGLVRLRPNYFDQTAQPATSSLIFEGLPSLDAFVGIDVIALAKADEAAPVRK